MSKTYRNQTEVSKLDKGFNINRARNVTWNIWMPNIHLKSLLFLISCVQKVYHISNINAFLIEEGKDIWQPTKLTLYTALHYENVQYIDIKLNTF